MTPRLSVRMTDDLSDALAVIQREEGGNASAAVRRAVEMLADAYRFARDYGIASDAEPVRVTYEANGVTSRV